MKKKKIDEGKSVTSVVFGLVIVIMIAGWGCMASSYEAHLASLIEDPEEPGRPPRRIAAIIMLIRGLIIFANTAIDQIPNLFTVIGWHLQNRIWLPLITLILAGCAVLFGFGLKMMEGVADDPYAKHRAKRAKKPESGESPKKRPTTRKKKRRR